MIIGNAPTRDKAIDLAIKLSKVCKVKPIYLIRWPSQYWTVETRKPSTKSICEMVTFDDLFVDHSLSLNN